MENEERTEGKDSIKLTKNTKGYNWEIKIYALESGEINQKDLDRLDKWNERLKFKYGGQNE